MPHIKDGKLKPLAVFTKERVKDLPDVLTIAEAGYPDAAYLPWYGSRASGDMKKLVKRIHESTRLESPGDLAFPCRHSGQPMPLDRWRS